MAGRFSSWVMSVRAKSCLVIGSLSIDRPGEGPSSGSLIGRRPSRGRSRPSIQGQVSSRPSSPTKEPQLAPTTSTTSTYPDGLKTYHSRESSVSSHTARRWEDRNHGTRPHEHANTSTSSPSKSNVRSATSVWGTGHYSYWSQVTDSHSSRYACEFQPRRRNTPPAHPLRSHPNTRRQANDRLRDHRHWSGQDFP